MIYYSQVTPKGNSSYSYDSQADAEARAKWLDDHGSRAQRVETMNLKPIHLEEIRLSAMSGARGIRARGVECRTVLLLFHSTPAGELGSLDLMDVDDADKDIRAALQQKFARSPDVAAAVLINEGWQSIITPGAPVPNTTEGDPARQEVLLINVLTAREQWLLVAEIHDNKIDDAQFQKVENGNLQGRFIRAEANA